MAHLRKYMGKRSRSARLLLLTAVMTFGYLCTVQPLINSSLFRLSIRETDPTSARCHDDGSSGIGDITIDHQMARQKRSLFSTTEESVDNSVTVESSSEQSAVNVTIEVTPLFPEDLFTIQQRRHGAVILHVLGMIYMFVALAIVCDEFFIPALDVIIEKLAIQDDVAGATFMAAGGSAPELFTSVIGVFVSFDDVGIGTIVGSAVFNILFVIGMCALFSKSVLYLTWWPLFRDVTFYSISLLVLIAFFLDNKIYWWEALLLLLIYASYVYFMRWNAHLERFVKKHINMNKVARVSSADQLVTSNGAPIVAKPTSAAGTLAPPTEAAPHMHRRASTPLIHAGSKFRHGLLQLMIHSIDPLNETQQGSKIDEKTTQIHAIASLKVLLDATRQSNAASNTPATTTTTTAGCSESDSQDNLAGSDRHAAATAAATAAAVAAAADQGIQEVEAISESDFQHAVTADSVVSIRGNKGVVRIESANQLNHVAANHVASANGADNGKDDDSDEVKEPLDMSWPDTARKRLTYVILAPIVIPLWLTLPDPRRPEKKKWFAITFIGSILWIAAFSYLMVWWASMAGQTFNIPNEVMGLTFLAAGTSIPDLITSVIVARKGLGDMAVSSSIGSNIFDVTVGLPLPWFLYGLVNLGNPVPVSSQGMACSIVILFLMLLFVIVCIACFRWKMNKGLGISMFVLYFAFLAVSLLFEYGIWSCPL